ncbi:probable protein ROS1A at C-terminar half [Coccomyxa sp. Obi]|nr:probable protein ROS1A at C-terminar half [Coccomyxa sp. Obi]
MGDGNGCNCHQRSSLGCLSLLCPCFLQGKFCGQDCRCLCQCNNTAGMDASLAPFSIGTGCQAFLRQRQSEAAARKCSMNPSTQQLVEHEGSVHSVLTSSVIGTESQPDWLEQTNNPGPDGALGTGPVGPGFVAGLLGHMDEDTSNNAWQLLVALQADQHESSGQNLAGGQNWSGAAISATPGISVGGSLYLSLCCMHRLASKEDMYEQHGSPGHTVAEALADITLQVLHEHDFDLDAMESAHMHEARMNAAPRSRPGRTMRRPLLPAPQPSSMLQWEEESPPLNGVPVPNPEATAQKKKVRRARILKDGQLTMIMYGADEALKWQMRVSMFLQAARGVLGNRRRIPGQWGGSVLDSVVGVFLTQNVSDALSSKAWMTLAATFPLTAMNGLEQEGIGSSAAMRQAVHLQCCDKDTADSVDWEAVRVAPTEQVAEAIKCRGMHNVLAARLQVLLNEITTLGPGLRAGVKDNQKSSAAEEQRSEAGPGESKSTEKHAADAAPDSTCTSAPMAKNDAPAAELTPGHQASSLANAPCCAAEQVTHEEQSAQQRVAAGNVMSRGEGMRAIPDMELPMACLAAEQNGSLVMEDEDAIMLDRVGNDCPANENLRGRAHREQDVDMVEAWKPGDPERVPNGSAPILQLDKEPMESEQDRAVEEGIVHPMTLEWLRDLTVEDARQYLMGVTGLGRKSVACVLLLALSKHDFPVDTNVGRICARLGWIPLDAEEALEDMDRYAPEPEVHKYLHSRLMHFDLDTLYELHYQMITLGKVFCSKRDPNCSACPLRPQCEYAQANGRHFQKKTAPSTAAVPEADHVQAQPATPQAAEAPHQSDTSTSEASESKVRKGQDGAYGQLSKSAVAGGHEQLVAEAGSSEGSDPLEGPNTPKAQRSTPTCAARKEQKSLFGPLDDRHLDFPATEESGARTARLVGSAAPDSPGSSESAANEDEALPDVEDLGGTCVPSKAPRTQSAELARILDRGEEFRKAVDERPPGGPPEVANLRSVEAAAAVLDISPAQSTTGAGDILARLQDYDTLGIRRRFRELSVVVHPDKCMLPGARQAFEHLLLAQEILVKHVNPQQDGTRGGEEGELPGFAAHGGARGGQHVQLQAYEVPDSYIDLLKATVTEHQTSDDLPLLLLPLPAVPVSVAVPASKAADSETAQLPEPCMQTNDTAPADTTDAAPAQNIVAAAAHAPVEAPGMKTLPGCQPSAEDVEDAVMGAAGSCDSAGQQPGYALLVPCRTAMRGRFPLNGTYFQVNEMFLDDSSLRCPIQVAAEVVGTWVRRPVYFGLSVVGVCRGMRQAEVTRFFSDGLLCVRAFDPITRFPCPLPSWTLPGKAPKAPGTPPAAERAKGKRPRPDQAAMRMIGGALEKARQMTAVEVPSNALVAVDPGVTGTVMPAIPSSLRVKRKYTKRKSKVPVATALWRGNAAVSGPLGASVQQALVLAGDVHNAAARVPGQAVLFGSPVEDSAAALGGQPALEAISMQVQDAGAATGRPTRAAAAKAALSIKATIESGRRPSKLRKTRHSAP